MHLHVLSPAFGLASIDAECLAAVALVKSYCDGKGIPWHLSASHKDEEHLPMLSIDGRRLYGFNAIASEFHLLDDLSELQQADAAA